MWYDQTGLVLETGGVHAGRTLSYYPYGESLATTGSMANPLRYTGGYLDGTSGWTLLGARYYQVYRAYLVNNRSYAVGLTTDK